MTLQRYVFKQLALALLFAGGGILFVLLPAILVNAVHKVGSAGLLALAFYLPLVLADLVPYILPLGFLLAVVTTFGRMAADREWTAVRSAGIQPAKLLIPGVVIAVALGLGTDWLASTLSPRWEHRLGDYRRTVLQNAVKRFSPGRTEVRIPGFFLTAARREPGLPIFYEAHISVLRSSDAGDDESFWMYADRVSFELHGSLVYVSLKKARLIKGSGGFMNEEPVITLDLDQLLKTEKVDPNRPKYLPSSEMRRRIEAGEVPAATAEAFAYEIQSRHALAATYLLFLLIGFPTGIRMRSGTQLAAFAAAVAYAIAYYVLSLRFAQLLHTSGALPASVAPWVDNALGSLVGGWFTWRVVRE